MKNSGIVKNVNGTLVTLSMYKETACSHCNKCSDSNKVTNDFKFNTDKKLEVGDIVTFEIEDKKVLKAATIVYIIPIIAMFLGYYLSSTLNYDEPTCIIFSFLALVLSFIGVYFYDKKLGRNHFENDIVISSIKKVEGKE